MLHKPDSISTILGTIAFIAGILNEPNTPNMIFYGICILYYALAATLILWGILGELIYRTGDLKMDYFAKIKEFTKQA